MLAERRVRASGQETTRQVSEMATPTLAPVENRPAAAAAARWLAVGVAVLVAGASAAGLWAPGLYTDAAPDTIQRRFLDTGGTINPHGDHITIRLDRRAYSPVLRAADLPDTTVPWWHGRTLHFEYA